MKYLFLSLYSLSILMGVTSVNDTNDGDKVLGLWWTDDKRAKVEIYKKGEEYWGKIVWLKEPNYENGNPKRDKENPNEGLRKKPIIGLNLISGFTYDDDRWTDGDIYDPENGKTYDCVMKIKKGKLELRGYVGFTMFGRTVTWTSAD